MPIHSRQQSAQIFSWISFPCALLNGRVQHLRLDLAAAMTLHLPFADRRRRCLLWLQLGHLNAKLGKLAQHLALGHEVAALAGDARTGFQRLNRQVPAVPA